MPKNKISQDQIKMIQDLSYQELGNMLTSGTFTPKQLRNAYTQMRDIAVKRLKRLESEKNVKQFGKPNLYINNGEYFRKTKYLTSESELLKEIADVSKFLTSKRSTISGLKETREKTLETLREAGYEISKDQYVDFMKFMKWFKSSEFSKRYDSDSPVVAEIFNSEKASPADWRRAFEQYSKHETRSTPVRQY